MGREANLNSPLAIDSYPFIASLPEEVTSVHHRCLTSYSFLYLPSIPTDIDKDPFMGKSKPRLFMLAFPIS